VKNFNLNTPPSAAGEFLLGALLIFLEVWATRPNLNKNKQRAHYNFFAPRSGAYLDLFLREPLIDVFHILS
jgi:hypothetical protein